MRAPTAGLLMLFLAPAFAAAQEERRVIDPNGATLEPYGGYTSLQEGRPGCGAGSPSAAESPLFGLGLAWGSLNAAPWDGFGLRFGAYYERYGTASRCAGETTKLTVDGFGGFIALAPVRFGSVTIGAAARVGGHGASITTPGTDSIAGSGTAISGELTFLFPLGGGSNNVSYNCSIWTHALVRVGYRSVKNRFDEEELDLSGPYASIGLVFFGVNTHLE